MSSSISKQQILVSVFLLGLECMAVPNKLPFQNQNIYEMIWRLSYLLKKLSTFSMWQLAAAVNSQLEWQRRTLQLMKWFGMDISGMGQIEITSNFSLHIHDEYGRNPCFAINCLLRRSTWKHSVVWKWSTCQVVCLQETTTVYLWLTHDMVQNRSSIHSSLGHVWTHSQVGVNKKSCIDGKHPKNEGDPFWTDPLEKG